MPLVIAIGAAALAFGGGVYLAGQGTEKIAGATTQVAVLGAALFVAYLALKHG